jgi:enamine deaminase RidA (YjgF/YER057c/UK114 family)
MYPCYASGLPGTIGITRALATRWFTCSPPSANIRSAELDFTRREMNMNTTNLMCCLILLAGSLPAAAHDIVRRSNPSLPIASSVSVPAGTELVFLSGMLADAADAEAPPGSTERFGDTAAQTRSVLEKIAGELAKLGLGMEDVVKMNVYVVGDPDKGGRMDFAGLMQAYMQFYGRDGASAIPARTTVQVAGLPLPGALVEIEVVAARHPDHDDPGNR